MITAPRRNHPPLPNNGQHPPQPIPVRAMRGKGDATRAARALCAPVGEKTPQVDILGPTIRCWGEVPHRRLGMAAWTHLSNSEGSCLPLCGLDAEK